MQANASQDIESSFIHSARKIGIICFYSTGNFYLISTGISGTAEIFERRALETCARNTNRRYTKSRVFFWKLLNFEKGIKAENGGLKLTIFRISATFRTVLDQCVVIWYIMDCCYVGHYFFFWLNALESCIPDLSCLLVDSCLHQLLIPFWIWALFWLAWNRLTMQQLLAISWTDTMIVLLTWQ